MPPLVPLKPEMDWYYNHVVENQRKDTADPNTTVVLMTGRHIGLKNRVMEIIDNANMVFDDTYFAGQSGTSGSNTFEIKANNIKKLLLQGFSTIEIWEDREEHVREFANLCKELIANGIINKAIVHDVKTNESIQI